MTPQELNALHSKVHSFRVLVKGQSYAAASSFQRTEALDQALHYAAGYLDDDETDVVVQERINGRWRAVKP